MDIRDIDHLEFYVGDAHQTAYYLCTAFGFRVCGRGGPHTGLTDQHSLLLGHGDIRVVLTTGTTPDHPATRYVSRHGDGVAVIAFGTDDAAGAFAQAVGRGATPLIPPMVYEQGGARVTTASVSGFSDVTHRLVQRDIEASLRADPSAQSTSLRADPSAQSTSLRADPSAQSTSLRADLSNQSTSLRADPSGDPSASMLATSFLPGAFDPIVDPRSDDDLLEVIDHAAICVGAGDLDLTSRYYQHVFDFSEIFEEYIDVGGQGMNSKVVQSPSRRVTFTLIEPDVRRRPGQIDDFLQWHAGAGVQHVAFRTSDIVRAVRTISSRGVNFLATPRTYYDLLEQRLGHIDLPIADLRQLGVLVDSDHWGQMYQIFTESIHIRRTLFLELIERHGALTFGSSNIKALYEAKERELAAPVEIARERVDDLAVA